MPPRFLLDTDICIYLRSNRSPATTARFAALVRGEAAVSVITFGEFAFGAARSGDPVRSAQSIEWLTRTVEILPLPSNAAIEYGRIRAELFRSLIGGNDLLIAAHALADDLVLVTNNEREFRRVRGLKIENWSR